MDIVRLVLHVDVGKSIWQVPVRDLSARRQCRGGGDRGEETGVRRQGRSVYIYQFASAWTGAFSMIYYSRFPKKRQWGRILFRAAKRLGRFESSSVFQPSDTLDARGPCLPISPPSSSCSPSKTTLRICKPETEAFSLFVFNRARYPLILDGPIDKSAQGSEDVALRHSVGFSGAKCNSP